MNIQYVPYIKTITVSQYVSLIYYIREAVFCIF